MNPANTTDNREVTGWMPVGATREAARAGTDRDRLAADRAGERREQECDEIRRVSGRRLAAAADAHIARRLVLHDDGVDDVDRHPRAGVRVGEVLRGDDERRVTDRPRDVAGDEGALAAHADEASVASFAHRREHGVRDAQERERLPVDGVEHLRRGVRVALRVERPGARRRRDDDAVEAACSARMPPIACATEASSAPSSTIPSGARREAGVAIAPSARRRSTTAVPTRPWPPTTRMTRSSRRRSIATVPPGILGCAIRPIPHSLTAADEGIGARTLDEWN